MATDSVIIVRLDKQIKDGLQKMAEKDGRTISSFVRFILKKVISGEIKL